MTALRCVYYRLRNSEEACLTAALMLLGFAALQLIVLACLEAR